MASIDRGPPDDPGSGIGLPRPVPSSTPESSSATPGQIEKKEEKEEKEREEKEITEKRGVRATDVTQTARAAIPAVTGKSAQPMPAVKKREYRDSDIPTVEHRIDHIREEIAQFRKISKYTSTSQRVEANRTAGQIQEKINALQNDFALFKAPAEWGPPAWQDYAIHKSDITELKHELASAASAIFPKTATLGERIVEFFTRTPYQVRRLKKDIETTKDEIEKTRDEYHKAMLGRSSKGDFDGSSASLEKMMTHEKLINQLALLQERIDNIKEAKSEFDSLTGMKDLQPDIQELEREMRNFRREAEGPVGIAHQNLMIGYGHIASAVESRKSKEIPEEMHSSFMAHRQLQYFDQLIEAAKAGKLPSNAKIGKQELESIIQMRDKLKVAVQETEDRYHFSSLTTDESSLLEKIREAPDPSKLTETYIDFQNEENLIMLVQLRARLKLNLFVQGRDLPHEDIRQTLRDIYCASEAIQALGKAIEEPLPTLSFIEEEEGYSESIEREKSLAESIDVGNTYQLESEIEFLVSQPTLSQTQIDRLSVLTEQIEKSRNERVASLVIADANRCLHEHGIERAPAPEAAEDMEGVVKDANALLRQFRDDYTGNVDIEDSDDQRTVEEDLHKVILLLSRNPPATIVALLGIYKVKLQAAIWSNLESQLDSIKMDTATGILSTEDARQAKELLPSLINARRNLTTPNTTFATKLEIAIEKLSFLLGEPIPQGLISQFRVLQPREKDRSWIERIREVLSFCLPARVGLAEAEIKFTRSFEAMAYSEVIEKHLEIADRAVLAQDKVPLISGRHEHIWGNRRKVAEAIFIASEKLKQFDAWLKTLPPAMEDSIRRTLYEPRRKEFEAFAKSNFHPFEIDFDSPPGENILDALEFLPAVDIFPFSDKRVFPIPTLAFRKAHLDFPGRPTESGEVLIHHVSMATSKADMDALLKKNPMLAEQMTAVFDQLEMNVLANPELSEENSRLRDLKLSQLYHLKRQLLEYAPETYKQIEEARSESLVAQAYQEQCELEEQLAYILTKAEALDKNPELVANNPEQAAAVRNRCLTQIRAILPEIIHKAPGIASLAKLEKRLIEEAEREDAQESGESKSKRGEEVEVKEREEKVIEEARTERVAVRDMAYLELERKANKIVVLLNKLRSTEKENQTYLDLTSKERKLLSSQTGQRPDATEDCQKIIKKLGARAFNAFELDMRHISNNDIDLLESHEAREQLFMLKIDMQRDPELFRRVNRNPEVKKIFNKLEDYITEHGEADIILRSVTRDQQVHPHLISQYKSIFRGINVNIDNLTRGDITYYSPFIKAILANKEVRSLVLADSWSRLSLQRFLEKAPHLEPPTFKLQVAIANLNAADTPDGQKKAMLNAIKEFVALHTEHPEEADNLRGELHRVAEGRGLLDPSPSLPTFRNRLTSGTPFTMTPELEKGVLNLFFEAICNPSPAVRFGHLTDLYRANPTIYQWTKDNGLAEDYSKFVNGQPGLFSTTRFAAELELAEDLLLHPHQNREALLKLASSLDEGYTFGIQMNQSQSPELYESVIQFLPPLVKQYADIKPRLEVLFKYEKEDKAKEELSIQPPPTTFEIPEEDWESPKTPMREEYSEQELRELKGKMAEEAGRATRPHPLEAGTSSAPKVSSPDEDYLEDLYSGATTTTTPMSQEERDRIEQWLNKGREEEYKGKTEQAPTQTPFEFVTQEEIKVGGEQVGKFGAEESMRAQQQESKRQAAAPTPPPAEEAVEWGPFTRSEAPPAPIPGDSPIPTPPELSINAEESFEDVIQRLSEAPLTPEGPLTPRTRAEEREKLKELEDELQVTVEEMLAEFEKLNELRNQFEEALDSQDFDAILGASNQLKDALQQTIEKFPSRGEELESELEELDISLKEVVKALKTPELDEDQELKEPQEPSLGPPKVVSSAKDEAEGPEVVSAEDAEFEALQRELGLEREDKLEGEDLGVEIAPEDLEIKESLETQIEDQYELLKTVLKSFPKNLEEQKKYAAKYGDIVGTIENRLVELGQSAEQVQAFSDKVLEHSKKWNELEALLLATPFNARERTLNAVQIANVEKRLMELGVNKEELERFKDNILAGKKSTIGDQEEFLKKMMALESEGAERIAQIRAESEAKIKEIKAIRANIGDRSKQPLDFEGLRRAQEKLEKEVQEHRQKLNELVEDMAARRARVADARAKLKSPAEKIEEEDLKASSVSIAPTETPKSEPTISSEEKAALRLEGMIAIKTIDEVLEEIEKDNLNPNTDPDFADRADSYLMHVKKLLENLVVAKNSREHLFPDEQERFDKTEETASNFMKITLAKTEKLLISKRPGFESILKMHLQELVDNNISAEEYMNLLIGYVSNLKNE